MIELRLRRSQRNGIRVNVYRKFNVFDRKIGKTKYTYKQIGSFLLSDVLAEVYDPKFLALLEPEEQMQLKNFVAEASFGYQLDTETDELMKFSVLMPEKFHEALIQLHVDAAQAGMHFVPSQIIMEALLKKAKIVQNKMSKQGIQTDILEKIGMSAQETDKPMLYLKDVRQLFKKALELNQTLGKTCLQLEEASRTYGKTKKIPPPQLREWAGDMPKRDLNKPIQTWAVAAVIDVLLLHGLNPSTLIDLNIVAHYWALQQQKTLTLNKATEKFIQLFTVPESKKSAVLQEIKRVYTS